MLKKYELSDSQSCLSKARDDELIFVLLERDVCASGAVREWVRLRIASARNRPEDSKIIDAVAWADAVDKANNERLRRAVEAGE